MVLDGVVSTYNDAPHQMGFLQMRGGLFVLHQVDHDTNFFHNL